MGNKINRNVEFLTDDFGNLVGYQKSPGVEVGLVTSKTNSVTGGVEIIDPKTGLPIGSGSIVSITGSNAIGSVLTATLASGWTAAGFQWTRNSVILGGATASTYTLSPSDSASSIACVVTGLSNASTGLTVATYTAIINVNARLVVEGDSITAGSNGPQWSFFVQCKTAGYFYTPTGWNQATGGETAQQTLAQSSAVVALTPEVVCYLAGTNDLSGTARTPDQIASDIQGCITAYLAGGAKAVAVCKVLPRNGGAALTAPREADRLTLNGLISAMAAPSVVIVDIETTFNPTVDCIDGLHPNWLGAKKIGEAFSSALVSISGAHTQSSKYLDAGNICGAAAMLGTAGAKSGALVTGSVADGWTVEDNTGATVACSKVVGSDGVERQRMLVSGTNSAAGNIVRFRKSFTANVSTAQVADILTEISLSGIAGVRSISVSGASASTTSGSATVLMGGDFVFDKAIVRPAQSANGSAITSIYYSVVLTFAAGTIAADLIVGKPYIKVITST